MKQFFSLMVLIFAFNTFITEADAQNISGIKWQPYAITNPDGSSWKQVAEDDFFLLSDSANYFNYTLNKENIFARGNWKINNGVISLTYAPKPQDIQADSTRVITQGMNTVVEYYNAGKLIATISDNQVLADRITRNYTILKATPDTLIFTENNITFAYTAQKKQALVSTAKADDSWDFSITAILRGFVGMLVLLAISYLFSSNKKAVEWRVVATGLLIQLVLAFGILKIPAFAALFEIVGKIFVLVLDFTREGSVFLLGDLLDISTYGFIFAFQVLPTIIFFSALTSLLFYLGVIQKVVYVLAWAMSKSMRLSGAESLSVAGNIFLGQTESPLLIKAYLNNMNRSEILLVMSGGMATLAGGVLASYIAFLGGGDSVQELYFAKHLLAASVMAAPGVIVISKIILPQTQDINKNIDVSKEKIGSNALDSISNGTSEGLKLAVNVAAMLLTFLAFIAMTNYVLMKVGGWTHLNGIIHDFDPQYSGLDLKFILGYIFAPIVWLMGVPSEDITLVGRLIGEKLIVTEFVAYISLADLKTVGDAAFGSFSSQKSILMATYALCGFANIASIGIQIGGIGTLAPMRRKDLSELGFRALIAGSLASLMSATIVGMITG